MSDFKSFLEEQMKSEEFRREYEALAPDYELVLRGDVDPRNLANPRRLNGEPYTDYERGYNDGVIAAYWLTRSAKAVEAEPVVHAHWVSEIVKKCDWKGRKRDYYQPYSCPVCHTPDLRKGESKYCSECGAKMDKEIEDV